MTKLNQKSGAKASAAIPPTQGCCGSNEGGKAALRPPIPNVLATYACGPTGAMYLQSLGVKPQLVSLACDALNGNLIIYGIPLGEQIALCIQDAADEGELTESWGLSCNEALQFAEIMRSNSEAARACMNVVVWLWLGDEWVCDWVSSAR